MPLRNLSTILWRERRLVGELLPGASAFSLHVAELDRAIVVNALTERLDLDDDVTLRDLAARLPEPWCGVFQRHHEALAAVDRAALPRSLADFLR